jgi:hypothetical protein
MPVSISGTTGITSPTITTTGVIVSGTTVADATAVIRPLVSATSVASTSGTSIDFTSIPSWVKRITVMFNGVSTNGSSNWLLRIGNGSFTTTGYLGSSSYNGAANGGVNSTVGFIFVIGSSSQTMHGSMTLTLIDASTNKWVEQGVLGDSSQAYTFLSGGSTALSGVLDRVRITTVNGTDTFDAGSINILYE